VQRKLARRASVDRVVRLAASRGEGVETALVREGLVSKTRLLVIKAQLYGLESLDLAASPPDLEAVASLLPEPMARRYRAVPLWHDHRRLMLAVQEPLDAIACSFLQMRCNLEIVQVVAFEEDIDATLRSMYRTTQRLPVEPPVQAEGKRTARLKVDPLLLELPTEVAPARTRPNVALPQEWRPSRQTLQQIAAQYPGESYMWRP